MRVRLGINNCFAVKRWPCPDDWAAIVKNDLGLDTVELSLDLLAGPDTPAGRDRMAEQTRAALVRHGLRADTVFTGLAAYSLNLLMHPDAEYRAAARRWYREAIDLTAQLGATAVGGHVGSLTVPDSADPARRAQRWTDLRENLADLAAYAHECGLDHLLVENLVTDREPSTMALASKTFWPNGAWLTPPSSSASTSVIRSSAVAAPRTAIRTPGWSTSGRGSPRSSSSSPTAWPTTTGPSPRSGTPPGSSTPAGSSTPWPALA